ncbi:hypothetical protein [Bifidobacterium aerophilum]|uniref:Uncharacterized protein n=1 Tax=Bifidobacterium aerophilum TaxID=1798155 RepID=A0A6N9Z3I1_9BIFI|nr:hypothetical protein [Bifidobacterium aerophilum]NEG88765.1 hypothetical protein [Bifidobacterium aerophilum]
MASLLQGFEEVRLVKPAGKTVMTVTATAVKFNKATAIELGYPAYVKILINDKTRQIAVTPTTAKADNAVKFSKPEGKQAASISVKDAAAVTAVLKYFELADAPEGEVSYQAVNGTVHKDEKVVIFDIDGATAGTMKRRGRKKSE